jgi:hypothetical protein
MMITGSRLALCCFGRLFDPVTDCCLEIRFAYLNGFIYKQGETR